MPRPTRLPKLPRPEGPSWLPTLNPFAWTMRAAASFHPGAMPPMTRGNYRRELAAALFLPWVIAAVEGGVAGVIVKKYFAGEVARGPVDLGVAVVTAAPAFANIMSFLFVRLSHGRHKIRSIALLQIGVAGMTGAMAVAPRSLAGLWIVVASAVLARVCLAGVITLRATVWRANYPRQARARLTGRISAMQTLVVALGGAAIGAAMDADEESFRWVVPSASLLSLAGVWAWSRVRVRRHRALLDAERSSPPEQSPTFNPLSVLGVLRQDRLFAWYMACQFTMGFANLMCFSILVIMIDERFELAYTPSMLITHGIRYGMIALTVPMWATLLDRMHSAKYRAIHPWVFVARTSAFFVAGAGRFEWLLYVAAVIHGLAFAGGSLAWNIGHNDFADDANASRYMAAHVTLTGMRGLVAPFAGVLLYRALESRFGPGAGSWTFGIASAMCALGALGFAWLATAVRREREEGLAAVGRA